MGLTYIQLTPEVLSWWGQKGMSILESSCYLRGLDFCQGGLVFLQVQPQVEWLRVSLQPLQPRRLCHEALESALLHSLPAYSIFCWVNPHFISYYSLLPISPACQDISDRGYIILHSGGSSSLGFPEGFICMEAPDWSQWQTDGIKDTVLGALQESLHQCLTLTQTILQWIQVALLFHLPFLYCIYMKGSMRHFSVTETYSGL